jgi:ATP-dependent DNA ligase
VTLWSRRANRFTDQFPTLSAACEHLAPDTLLDGEIIVLDQNGRISFNMLQHHRSQPQVILFYAFDVIIHRGRRLIHVPLDTTPAELIPLVKEFGFEGVIAKRRDSCYESGKRSGCMAQI